MRIVSLLPSTTDGLSINSVAGFVVGAVTTKVNVFEMLAVKPVAPL